MNALADRIYRSELAQFADRVVTAQMMFRHHPELVFGEMPEDLRAAWDEEFGHMGSIEELNGPGVYERPTMEEALEVAGVS